MKKFFTVIGLLILILVGYSIWGGAKMYKEEQSTKQAQMEIQTEIEEKKIENFDGTYVLDTKTSEVVWTGKKKIIKEWIDKGTIAVKSGDVTIKESLGDWQGTSGKIVFDMTTITSNKAGTKDTGGSTKLDTHLKSPDFFDIVKFPESSFVLTGVTKKDNGFDLSGDLTIKGVTKPITLASIKEIHFVEGTNQYIEARGSVSFNRTDFGVRYGSDSFFDNLGDNIIEDEVTLELLLVAKKQDVKSAKN